ncbi:MAG: uncharacterized protein QOH13_1201 [Thermoleophilaceae bacterium]|nr:uncharacterized protein [Thermoleophilaceae bacterium]
MPTRTRLSADEARRVALAAQGFAEPRRADGRAVRRLFDRVGIVQIDSVNVLSRAHYLPGFARLGPYSREALDRAAYFAPRRLFEYWAHEASLLPVELHPLMRWRMARAHDEAWGGMQRVARESPELLTSVLQQVRDRGPIAARDLEQERPRRKQGWWDWSDAKRAIEMLFWSGELTSARRRNFERLYDLPERVIPRAVLDAPTPAREDAQRELVRIAARAMGVAAERDLRDYFRLPLAEARQAVAELVEAGEIVPVEVEGWRLPGYLHAGARIPRQVNARALVGPFDSLVWERERVARLFGMRYRIEIYVPAPKRVHGYYVLPFLLGDRLVARVDLKADRQRETLRVQAAHYEPGSPPETKTELRSELELLAGWLGLGSVTYP